MPAYGDNPGATGDGISGISRHHHANLVPTSWYDVTNGNETIGK